MKSYKRKTPVRLIFAVVLIIASFLSAYFLSATANRTKIYWTSKSILSPGMIITSGDLVESRVALNAIAGGYLLANLDVKRSIVMTRVGAGELIPSSAISTELENIQLSAVPISVLASDLPTNILTGEVVNLYQIGDPRLIGNIVAPALILSSVSIVGVDKKGENLGGAITLTLSVKKVDVLKVLSATSSGRLVVVRVYG